jgi:hypothetical protein
MDHEPRDETEVHVDDEASGDDSMALGDPMAFGDGPTALAGEATRAASAAVAPFNINAILLL